tara:strand:- start:17280 stop:17819 length:540 start_codon:yes stop_codon:yes gene_type:complete
LPKHDPIDEDIPNQFALRDAMGRALNRDEWDGIPTPAALAQALRRLHVHGLAEQADDDRQPGLWHILIEAIIAALEGQEINGWRMGVIGPKGRPPAGFAKEDFDREVAFDVMQEMESGAGYESAILAVSKNRGCSTTIAKTAYGRQLKEEEAFLRFFDEMWPGARERWAAEDGKSKKRS